MHLVTFRPVCIASNRRRDNTYPVKIRVTFKGVSRRLPTTLVARPGDLSRTLKIKSPDILNRANGLISQMQEAIAGVSPFVLDTWDADRVVEYIKKHLRGDDFQLDFYDFAREFLQRKTPATRRVYETALRSFERFTGPGLDINSITRGMLVEFMEQTDTGNKIRRDSRTGEFIQTDKARKGGSGARYLSMLAHIFKAARIKYNDDDRVRIPRSPFEGIPKPSPSPDGQRNLGREIMQRIIDSRTEREALDIFLLSFVTMGANMADLWAATEVGTEWVYNRTKTKSRRQDRAVMRVVIQPEVAVIVGRLQSGPKGWWVPALHRCRKENCTAWVNRHLKKWAKQEGIETFTFYAARHTWATLARSIGIEKALVDECLCHVGDFRLTDIYAERDYSRMAEANRKVLDTLQF